MGQGRAGHVHLRWQPGPSVDAATQCSDAWLHALLPTAEAAEVLFDAGNIDVYSASREQLAEQLHREQAAERTSLAAVPPPAVTAAAAPEIGGGGEEAGLEEVEGGTPGGAGSVRRHRAPPPAAPAAAAEPAVSPDQPSVPVVERTVATTRGGAGVGAAAHGYAAAVPADLLEVLPSQRAPPHELEAGLGLPASAPTAEELHHHQQQQQASSGGEPAADSAQQLRERRAAAPPEGQAAIDAALAEAAIAGGGAALAPAAQEGQAPFKAMAFDNQTANLAALPAGGRNTPAEE